MYYKHRWLHTKLENRFKLSVHDKKIFGSTLYQLKRNYKTRKLYILF